MESEGPLRRLDHLVVEVPEIEAAHRRLLDKGFPEAWPVGRTWPFGRTSGIFLGGLNLELLEPDEGSRVSFDPRELGSRSWEKPTTPTLTMVVYAPKSVETVVALHGARALVATKTVDDPEALARRGFPPELWGEPQTICTNVFLTGEDRFFFCAYGAFLAGRLDPAAHRGRWGEVIEVSTPFDLPPPESGPRVVRGDAAVTFAHQQRLTIPELCS